MKAMVISEYGGPERLRPVELPTPEPGQGQILVRVKAFGINRAEIYMRKGIWGNVAPVSGIECVGIVEHDPAGVIENGKTVAVVMGGMGRTINGSYAEFTCAPASNVVPLETSLCWASLAAIPESYCTAWSVLFGNLALVPGQTIFVRGGTSALGQAAINIAAHVPGVTVLASTRKKERAGRLTTLGASKVFIEGPGLHKQVRGEFRRGVDAVMDVLGNTTMLDSTHMLRRDGRVCVAGFLGGGTPIQFNPLSDLPPGVNLNFFASFMFGSEDFPLSGVPLQGIVDRAQAGTYQAEPVQIFEFDALEAAHRLMEEDTACGKIVVTM